MAKRINNKKGYNQHKKKKIEVVKKLTPYENYRELCKIEWRQQEIRELVRPLMEEFRSLSQKKSKYIMKPKELINLENGT